MIDSSTYGADGHRSRLIRWEFAVLLALGAFVLVIPSIHSFLRFGPYFYEPELIDVWLHLGLIVVLLWIAWMSGDSFEMFGIAKPEPKDLIWFCVAILISSVLFFGPLWSLLFPQDKESYRQTSDCRTSSSSVRLARCPFF